MKICHVVYIPRLSGAEMLVRDLAIHQSLEGHQLSILSLEPMEESFKPILSTIQAHEISTAFPDQPLGKLSRLKFLIQYLVNYNPDVVVAHAVIPSIYTRLALKFTKIASVPVVSVLHDASQDDYVSTYFRRIEKFLKPSEHVVAITGQALDNYKRRCGSKSQFSVIPNGIDLSSFQVVPSRREQTRLVVFSTEQNSPIYLQVGRFNRNKQQHLSIKAFIEACQNQDFSGKLFLAGLIEDKEYFLSLQQMVKKVKLEERIVFLGPRSDIPDLLYAADVYLMPSLKEAHSIAFLEALASGITVIISDISAFEPCKQFPGVAVLQPNNIHEFTVTLIELGKKDLLQRWQRDLSVFSIQKTANAYLEVFNSLLY